MKSYLILLKIQIEFTLKIMNELMNVKIDSHLLKTRFEIAPARELPLESRVGTEQVYIYIGV